MYHRSCSWILLIAALVSAVSLGQPSKGAGGVVNVAVWGEPKVVYSESYALVVGINRYPDGGAFRSLTFAVPDAEAVRGLLVGVYGFPDGNVTLLTDRTDSKPTRRAILAGLSKLSQVRSRDARVVLYFSGHGQTADISREDVMNAGLLDDHCIPMAQVRRKLTICEARALPLPSSRRNRGETRLSTRCCELGAILQQ